MYDVFRSIIKHTGIYGLGDLAARATGFLLIPVYTRYLSPADYGILELLMVSLNLSLIVYSQGMHTAFFRSYSLEYQNQEQKQKEVISTSYYYMIVTGGLGFGFLCLVSNQINTLLFKTAEYSFLLRLIFVSGFFTMTTSIPLQLLRARLQSTKYTIISFVSFLLGMGLNIYFIVILRTGLSGIVYSNLIRSVIISLLCFVLVHRVLVPEVCLTKLKGMLTFGLPLIPSGLAIWVLTMSDRYFLQHLSTPDELGLYSLGYRFGMILQLVVIEPFLRAWPSIYFPLAARNDAPKVFAKIMTYFLTITLFLSLGVIFFSKIAIRLMSPTEYWNAFSIVSLIVFSTVLWGTANIAVVGLHIKRKTKYVSIIIGVSACLNLILNYLLIPTYGMMGAASATLFSYLAMVFFIFWINRKIYPVPYEHMRVFKLLAILGILFLISQLIGKDVLLSNMAYTSLILLAYPILLYIFRFLTQEETAKLPRLVRRPGHIIDWVKHTKTAHTKDE